MTNRFFNLSLGAVAAFFFFAVLPALNFDDKIRSSIEAINAVYPVEKMHFSEHRIHRQSDRLDEARIETIKNQLSGVAGLSLRQNDGKITLEFQKPRYIFLYSNTLSEQEFNSLLPRQFSLRIYG